MIVKRKIYFGTWEYDKIQKSLETGTPLDERCQCSGNRRPVGPVKIGSHDIKLLRDRNAFGRGAHSDFYISREVDSFVLSLQRNRHDQTVETLEKAGDYIGWTEYFVRHSPGVLSEYLAIAYSNYDDAAFHLMKLSP